MAVDYTTAETVNVEEGVYSADYNKLALAFNDRLKNGVADPTWRLLWYAHSLVRGMRNPNGFNYAPEDEWWKVYAHIKEASGITWPTAAAGEPEGVNVSNPLGAFIYGLAPDIDNEEGRINGSGQFDPAGTTLATAPTGVPLFINDGGTLRAPANITDYWELAKYQRGAVASDLSDYSASNAIKASQEHGLINYPDQHYFLKNYGGFLPSPPLDSSPICSDGYSPNYDLKFTNLVGGSNKTYDTCPPTGVMFYFEGFTAYKIVKWDGTTESLPLTDYIEGPYESAALLRRYKGQQLNQALNWFAMEYRANETERAEADMNRYNKGFQFQDFLTRQYALAPAYGEVSSGSITAVYPTFNLDGVQAAEAYLTVTTSGTYSGGTYYTVPAKFTFAGYFAKTTGAGSGIAAVDVIDASSGSDVVIDSFTLDTTGTTKRLKYFNSAYNEAKIRFQLKENLPSNLGVNIECAMLLDYKPNIYDSYVCLRLGSTDGPLDTNYDKSGYTFSNPKTVSDNLLDYGCIIRAVAGVPTNTGEINENPVYESARRLIQNNLRLAERQSLVGYEVIGGKSYLHFKRFARGQYSGDLDVFDGIAPPDDNVASGDLIEGEQYQVWSSGGSGTITYEGSTYAAISSSSTGGEQAGSFFTATSTKDFTTGGDAVVKIRNGIRSTPIKDNRNDRFRGQTNEWLTQMSTTVYKLSDSSIYKAEAYGDVLGFLTDRCGLLSCAWSTMGGCINYVASDSDRKQLNRHINYGSKMSYRPENPSGYRYALNTHGPSSSATIGANTMIETQNNASAGSGDINHFKSCQIYKPDLELEAVYIDPSTYYTDTDYNVIVKLNGRLDNENAPTSISNNSSSWVTSISGSYDPVRRTDENAVLEYLYHVASYDSGSISDYNCIQKVGDVAYDADAVSGYYANDFHGNCYPRFYFSKQVRHVWNDTNAQYDAADSLTTVDEMLYMEFVLQAISSGFIDKESSLQLSCTNDNRLYDYTFPNLCYQALKLSRADLAYEAVTRATNTFTWDADPNTLYTLVGIDGSGNETVIANSATSPHTQTGVATFTSYRAYAGSNNEENRTVIGYTLTTSGSNDVITFTEDRETHVRYWLLGRAKSNPLTSANANPWAYWTGSGWSLSESNAADVSSPVTVGFPKEEYRVEAIVYGRKRWFEFLPPTKRPDNAQGFGPMPNTNLYARIFNNVCNAVNLLTRARVDIPTTLQTRDKGIEYWVTNAGVQFQSNTGSGAITIDAPFDNSCSEGGIRTASPVGGADPGAPPNEGWHINGFASGSYSEATKPTNVSDGADGSWGDYSSSSPPMAEANTQIALLTSDCSAGGFLFGAYISGESNVTIESNRTNVQFRVKEENAKYALPVGIRDQFLNNPGIIGYMEYEVKLTNKDSSGTVPACIISPITADKYDSSVVNRYECVILDDETSMTINVKDSPLFGKFSAASNDFYYMQRDSSGSAVYCGNAAHATSTFRVYETASQFIRIPLVSRSYPANTY